MTNFLITDNSFTTVLRCLFVLAVGFFLILFISRLALKIILLSGAIIPLGYWGVTKLFFPDWVEAHQTLWMVILAILIIFVVINLISRMVGSIKKARQT